MNKKYTVYERFYKVKNKKISYFGITSQKFCQRKAEHKYRINLALQGITNKNNKYDKQSFVVAKHMIKYGLTKKDLNFRILFEGLDETSAKMIELLLVQTSKMIVNKKKKGVK